MAPKVASPKGSTWNRPASSDCQAFVRDSPRLITAGTNPPYSKPAPTPIGAQRPVAADGLVPDTSDAVSSRMPQPRIRLEVRSSLTGKSVLLRAQDFGGPASVSAGPWIMRDTRARAAAVSQALHGREVE